MPEQNHVQHTPVFISGSGYSKWSRGRDRREIPITNFVINADALIKDEGEWWFDCTLSDDTGERYEHVMLGRDEFLDAKPFKKAVSIAPNLLFKGNSEDVTEIRSIVSHQKPPEKSGVRQNGMHFIHGRWVYVEGDHIKDRDGDVDDIVFVGKKDPDFISHLLEQKKLEDNELHQLYHYLFRFNDSSVVYAILGWMNRCFIKERLSELVHKHNPYLVLQGLPGTGKSETANYIVAPYFGLQTTATHIAYNTVKTFAVKLTRNNIIPTAFDENKKASVNKSKERDFQNLLLASYEQKPYETGKSNSELNVYPCTSPVLVAGEMGIDSPSHRHRMIEVYYAIEKSEPHVEDYKKLTTLPLGSLGKAVLHHSLTISDKELKAEFHRQYAAVNPKLTNRYRENTTQDRMGLWLLLHFFESRGLNITEHEKGYAIIDEVVIMSAEAGLENNVDRMISDWATMSHSPNGAGNWLQDQVHYKIQNDHLYLYINAVYSLYQQFRRRHPVTAEEMPKSSFLQQIKSTRYYVETNGKKKTQTIRIGDRTFNGLILDLNLMPDHIDKNFLQRKALTV